nr:hypothetical protein [Chloroflexota bacterium]
MPTWCCCAPAVDRPRQITLTAEAQIGDEHSANAWPLWLFPRNIWRTARDITLLDPSGRLRELTGMAPGIDQKPLSVEHEQDKETRRQGDNISNLRVSPSPSLLVSHLPVMIATSWTPELNRFVERGGRALLLQASDGPPGPLS